MFLIRYLVSPTNAQRIVTNIIFFACVLASASLTGSFVSVFVICAMVWPFLWVGRYSEFQTVPGEVKLVAAAFALFFLVEAIGCLALGGDQAFSEAVENLPFLSVLPMWWVTQARPRQILMTLIKSAAAIALLSALIALLALHEFGVPRVELSAGNPNVLSIVAAILYVILAIGIAEDKPVWPRSWLSTALLAAVLLILSTGSRIMWLAILVVPPLVFLIMRPAMLRLQPRVFALGLVAVALIALALYKPVMQRLHYSQTEIAAISGGDLTSSAGVRIQLWRTGLQLFQSHPWFGVGPGNYQAAMITKTETELGIKIGLSHAHNMFINVLVRDGIFGLVAIAGMFLVPLAIAIRSLRKNSTTRRPFLAFLCGMQLVYLIAGLTGLAIGHDIVDNIFITGTVFVTYSLLFPNEDRFGDSQLKFD